MGANNQIDLELWKVTREFIIVMHGLPEEERKGIHDYLIAESVNPAMRHYIESVFAIIEGR